MGHGEALGSADVRVKAPVLRLGKARPGPGGVRQPEKRRAVGMLEVQMIQGDADRAMLLKAGPARGRGADEFAGLVMQP